jgi:hypothetical protein
MLLRAAARYETMLIVLVTAFVEKSELTKTPPQRLRNAGAHPASRVAHSARGFVFLGHAAVVVELRDLQHGPVHTILTGQRRQTAATGGMLDGRVGTPYHGSRVQPDVRFFLTPSPEGRKKPQ